MSDLVERMREKTRQQKLERIVLDMMAKNVTLEDLIPFYNKYKATPLRLTDHRHRAAIERRRREGVRRAHAKRSSKAEG